MRILDEGRVPSLGLKSQFRPDCLSGGPPMESVWGRQSLRLLAGCSPLEMGATHPSQAFIVMKHLDQKDLRAPRSTDEKLETSRGCVTSLRPTQLVGGPLTHTGYNSSGLETSALSSKPTDAVVSRLPLSSTQVPQVGRI